MSNNILRLPHVIHKIRMSKSWIYDQISDGNFPDQVPLGAHGVGWLESEIDAWLEERAKKRQNNDENKA